MKKDGSCSECGADWRGKPIPERDRAAGYYGDPSTAPTHYSRLIGVELPYDNPNHYDGVSFWRCPDCGAQWDRFTGELVPAEAAA